MAVQYNDSHVADNAKNISKSINLCTPDDKVKHVDAIRKEQFRDYSIDPENSIYGTFVRKDSKDKTYINRGEHLIYKYNYDSYSSANVGNVVRVDFINKQCDAENKRMWIESCAKNWKQGQPIKEETWRLYRYQDLIRCLMPNDWLVIVAEGEKCAELLLILNILATTFQASDWRQEAIIAALAELKAMRKLGGVVCLYDNDEKGIHNSVLLEKVCTMLEIPFKVVAPELLKTDCAKGYDVGDWILENEDLPISDLREQLDDIILMADTIPIQHDVVIKSPEDTEKYFIASVLRACEAMNQTKLTAQARTKTNELLKTCADLIQPVFIQNEEIAHIYDWYRIQILSGNYPTLQRAKNNYLKVDKYYRLNNDYKLEFLIKEIKVNHNKRDVDRLYASVRDRRDITVKDELFNKVNELFEADISPREVVSGILEDYAVTDGLTQLQKKKQLKNLLKTDAADIRDLIGSFNTQSLQAPQWIDGKEFLESHDEEDYFLYPGLCLAGRLNLLVGSTGAGKSVFALDMAASWVANQSFLGELPSKAKKPKFLVVINSDQSHKDLRSYCRANHKIVDCVKHGRFRPLGQISKDAAPFTMPFFHRLEADILDLSHQYEIVIVVDSLSGINKHKPAWSDTDSDAASAVTMFQYLCNKTGCTVIMLHHAGKDGFARGHQKSRGNSRIAEEASSLLIIDAIRNEETKAIDKQWLEIAKLRSCQPRRVDLKHNSSNFTFSEVPGYFEALNKRINGVQNQILGAMQSLPTGSKYDIQYLQQHFALGNKNHSDIELAFSKLIQRRHIQTHFDATQGKCFYSLTQ